MLVRRVAVAIGVFGGLAIAWPFFGAIFIFGICDAASCPSPAVLLAWAFSLPIVGVASVLAGILAPSKPIATAKTFFVAAAWSTWSQTIVAPAMFSTLKLKRATSIPATDTRAALNIR